MEYLATVSGAQRVLMLGEGDGRFLAAFVDTSQQSVVDSIESSSGMMRLAAGRVGKSKRVFFRQGDARYITLASGAYDLIVTHFFLDCFSTEECVDLVARIARASAVDARWVISEFRQPGAGIARYWSPLLIRACYFFFRITTALEVSRLPEYGAALQASGFRRQRHQTARGGLLISELWERDY